MEPRLPVPTGNAPSRGASHPLATVIVFSDFQCPFCAQLRPIVDKLVEAHPDKVRVHFRHLPMPFHDRALPAAKAAIEAQEQKGDAAFWKMHDILFERQALSDEDLQQYAEQLELSLPEFQAALSSKEHLPVLQRDVMAAAKLGVRGTPTTFINGRPIIGAQPYEEFNKVVQEELETAEKVIEAGVPRDELYPWIVTQVTRELQAAPSTAEGAEQAEQAEKTNPI